MHDLYGDRMVGDIFISVHTTHALVHNHNIIRIFIWLPSCSFLHNQTISLAHF